MNVVREIQKLNEKELELGLSGRGGSYHDDYKDSAWIFVGNLDFELTEGDVITIFSQYGEIVDINLIRDKGTGKSKGFAFVAYEDQRSTVLAVDNFNGTTLLGRTLRVDHARYKERKRDDEEEEEEPKPRIAPLGILPGDEKLIEAKGKDSDEESVDLTGLDPEDPMYDFLVAERRKQHKKQKKKRKKEKKEKKEKPDKKDGPKKERKRDGDGRDKEMGRQRPVSPKSEPKLAAKLDFKGGESRERDRSRDRRDRRDSRDRSPPRRPDVRSTGENSEKHRYDSKRVDSDRGDKKGDDVRGDDRRETRRRSRSRSRTRSPYGRRDRDRYDRRDRSRDRRRSRSRSRDRR